MFQCELCVLLVYLGIYSAYILKHDSQGGNTDCPGTYLNYLITITARILANLI